ncbi:unnamed protein product [Paramecium pentaurelia]|uniref:CDC20/Fizzy WD40 domain-containing protein n=1 Tax=Paramecium pentaurelia TaxID=43138 RepID=A0A8S1VAD7_9CILI|nr:unnamed protein product [Paramecium pentaurelia]
MQQEQIPQQQQNVTPKKYQLTTPTKDKKQNKTNQSTTIQSPKNNDFYSPKNVNPWKTPKSLLKSNHKQNTPDHCIQASPYSDRYIPLNVSRNLFNKQIQPFEIEEENQYEELLSENVLEIDENKHVSILNFNKQKHDKVQSSKQLETPKRKIDTLPIKVLDAPGLEDDFYQDTLHWGKNNLIAVGLQRCVYLYNVDNSKVFQLAEPINNNELSAYYTSLQWNTNGQILAIGCCDGSLKLWDYNKNSFNGSMNLSNKRISTISWANPNIFAYGSKDKTINICDVRVPNYQIFQLLGHTQEVCGVTFDGNELQLASGGNDNKVFVWQMRGGNSNNNNNNQYISWEIKSHKAAIRALAWNPNSCGILATGGGNQDKTIKIHSSLTNQQITSINCDSQVCKLRFSKIVNELVSTHGYEKNLVCLWQYPTMKRVNQLEGHSERVLYLSASPDESTILTGSGDETLKFWKIFPSQVSNNISSLFSMCEIR